VKQCMDAFLTIQFNSQLNKRMTREMLLRAVRRSDNHNKRFFANVEEVMELDDETLQLLVARYNSLDVVLPVEVPTLPVE